MRTPGHDEELALGFAIGEGLDPVAARLPDDLAANTVELEVRAFDPDRLRRHFYTSSSCGVCGKGALDAVAVEAPPVESDLRVEAALVAALPDRLREAQPTFALRVACTRPGCSARRASSSACARTWAGTTPWTRSSAGRSARACSRWRARSSASAAACRSSWCRRPRSPAARLVRGRRAVEPRRRARRGTGNHAVRLRPRRPRQRLLADDACGLALHHDRDDAGPAGHARAGAGRDSRLCGSEPLSPVRTGRRAARAARRPRGRPRERLQERDRTDLWLRATNRRFARRQERDREHRARQGSCVHWADVASARLRPRSRRRGRARLRRVGPRLARRPDEARGALRAGRAARRRHQHCGTDEPYQPIDVELLFGEPTVALRGPWSSDLVKIAPDGERLSAHGCSSTTSTSPATRSSPAATTATGRSRITEGKTPAVYAHVATDPEHPGKLALQYWLFYVFNDWNNLHEGDWEMIQLVFDASDAGGRRSRRSRSRSATASTRAPSGPTGATTSWSSWAARHPVVHPADGSHANFYGEALYLGSSASEGVGCDDTRGPTFDVRPAVQTIPSDAVARRCAEFPWIGFEGRWGELRPAFFNGPDRPEREEPVDAADQLVAGLARPQLHRPGRRDLRAPARPSSSAARSRTGRPRSCGWSTIRSASGVARGRARPDRPVLCRARDVAADGAAPPRASTRVGPDPRRLGPDVRAADPALPRDRRAVRAGLAARSPSSRRSSSTRRASFGLQTGGVSSGARRLPRARDRDVADAARARPRAGGDRPCARRARRGPRTWRARRLPTRARQRRAALRRAVGRRRVAVSLLVRTFFLLPIAIWLAGRWALVVPVVELEEAVGARCPAPQPRARARGAGSRSPR